MPAIVKVKVIEGRDLPIMDRASDLTDAFVELRLSNTTYKTEVCRKSLNPKWNSEWFKFEVDDEEIQEENLQIKVLDYDHYSSHDPIGKVNINLDTNIIQNGRKELGGYFPIYDTLHGIRGYIRLKVRIQFFIDANKYRQTSCGIQFFSCSGVPNGYSAVQFQGLVDELLVDDDPEYQWIDKIRTPRATNEARQRHFAKLSGEVKRKIGLKVLEVGGNAVIGYQQHFDLEGETGMVVRGIGTAVHLVCQDQENATISLLTMQSPGDLPPDINWASSRLSQIHQGTYGTSISSEIDHIPEKGNLENTETKASHKIMKLYTEDLEYPFFTITNPPEDFVLHIGGIVSARSVKLLDKINNPDEPETRDSWWNELRVEIRSHTKAMGCSAVIGYTEYTSIRDELMVLTAYGTAAVISTAEDVFDGDESARKGASDTEGDGKNSVEERLKRRSTMQKVLKESDLSSIDSETEQQHNAQEPQPPQQQQQQHPQKQQQSLPTYSHSLPNCHQCHVPYCDADVSLPVSLGRCMFCRQDKVPDILFATMEIPEEIPINGTGCLIQARVIRIRKKEKGEGDAENVSQILPFLEFDLHQQLINKLKIKGMNSIFGLKTRLSIGEQTIIAVATGTAVYLSALPPAPVIVLTSRKSSHNEEFHDRPGQPARYASGCEGGAYVGVQKRLMDVTKKNKEFFELEAHSEYNIPGKQSDENEVGKDISSTKSGRLDILVDGKESIIFELDDKSDACILPLLNERNYEGFYTFNTQRTPGIPLMKSDYQFFSMYQHIRIPPNTDDDSKIAQWLSSVCENCLLSLRLKTRAMQPCCLVKTSFGIEIAGDDYCQLTVNCLAVGVNEQFQSKTPRTKTALSRSMSSQSTSSKRSVDDPEQTAKPFSARPYIARRKKISCGSQQQQQLATSWSRGQLSLQLDYLQGTEQPCHQPPVTFCPMDCAPNMCIDGYLGNVNLYLIRESTDLKENGGVNLFMQQFIAEVHAIIRAHALALGGNAILSFYVNAIILLHNSQKNQAQCLINVSGDVAKVKTNNDPMTSLFCDVSHQSRTSSMQSSPNTPADNAISLEEIKYKLDRATFGTSV